MPHRLIIYLPERMKRLSQSDVTRLLEGAVLLKGVPRDQLTKLSESVRHRRFKSGELIFSKSDSKTPVYCIAEGRIRLTSTERGGNELLIALVDEGEMFGELALADDGPRAVNAVADRDSYVLEMLRRDLLPVVESNPSSAMAFSRMLCAHLREAVTTLENIGLHDAKTRLWLKLIHLGQRYGSVDAKTGRLRIQHGLSQQNLADSIGLTRVMVNRQLGIWRDKKLIRTGRGVIDIPDPDALETYVWEDSRRRPH